MSPGYGSTVGLAAAAAAALASAPARAQDEPPPANDAQQLAKDLANPISSMISLPFQFNVDGGLGESDGVRSTMNIQPVIPVGLGEDWNLIIRTIVPIIHQQDVVEPASSQFGLGDTLQSFFFSPNSGGVIWGVGPAILYPTGTDSALGSEKWGAGPTAIVLKQAGHNTIGVLANHIWSIAGDDSRADVSSTFIQPFFSHTTATAMTISLSAETTYDWKADQWTVPVILSAAQLTHIGKQPISVGAGLRYYVEKPEGGPEWGLRLITTFLFK
ncbi:hypothetical protein KK137_08520 [Croceibacterium sp. LX-88]|uniref:Transporter n=1 Tax=Croceibacterium selenioxidans TaxID=2838833 RepID=A0ABS5W3P9_9SPHN|nr:hypothetical protein [Croceibacterium selenioxidans]MBT2134373.1 hypothetical protein [Croceibacterium selenioxidans]